MSTPNAELIAAFTSAFNIRFSPARVILIVLDSVGVGELPDAAAYGDRGSDTLGNISRRVPLKLPTLRSLGLRRRVHRSA